MGFTLVDSWNCLYKPCLVTHWDYMGITLVGPRNCTWKATVFSTHWHCIGITLVDLWNCPCKDTILPHTGIAWGSHWLAHETARVKPLFCHLSLVVCYIFHLLIPLLWKSWFFKDCNRNCKNPVLDVIKNTWHVESSYIHYYNLLNIYFSSLIDLDTLIIMSPKIDDPYLWIRPLHLVPLNLAHRLV